MTRHLTVLALVALTVAGCGGSGSRPDRGTSASASSRIQVSTIGWRTDFKKHTVPLGEFVSGGPGKDGIPTIDHPRFAAAVHTHFLKPLEPVIELVVRGRPRAYPIQVLIWHEIVNDEIGGVPVTVTFCPLCNTAIVFDRRAGGRTLDFHVSGNLRNNDLVMYDRATESWWQQFSGGAVVGRYAGTRLRQLPARIVAWRVFRRRYPGGEVLQRPTGSIARPYGDNPYVGYDDVTSSPLFPVPRHDGRLLPKERVVFLERGGESVAVPLSLLARRRTVTVDLKGHRFVVRARGRITSPLDDPVVDTGRPIVTTEVLEHGRPVPFDEPFWFAVAAFRPNTRIVR